MHKTLKALDARGVVREDEALGTIRYRLENPFFAPSLPVHVKVVVAHLTRPTGPYEGRWLPR